MTAEEQKALREYCAFLLKEYGLAFSPEDPVIPALYVIYRHMKSGDESNKKLATEFSEALSKRLPREYHFHKSIDVWTFQLATFTKWALFSAMISTLIWVASLRWSQIKDVESARLIIASSKNLSHLLYRVRKNEQGVFFIDFDLAANDSISPFTEYQRLSKKTVRVYLGKDLTSAEP